MRADSRARLGELGGGEFRTCEPRKPQRLRERGVVRVRLPASTRRQRQYVGGKNGAGRAGGAAAGVAGVLPLARSHSLDLGRRERPAVSPHAPSPGPPGSSPCRRTGEPELALHGA